MSKKNVVFLFGAGASVPAGCKTTAQISAGLINTIENDPLILREFPWILPLWELLKLYSYGFHDVEILPANEKNFLKRFEPNFEQLIYLIELLDTYMQIGITLPKDIAYNPKCEALLQEITKNFNRRDILHPLIFYILTNLQPLTRNSVLQIHNPPIRIKSVIDFELANNALIQAIIKEFPTDYKLLHLSGFRGLLLDDRIIPVIATTNYDLVFESYFKSEKLDYVDGFSNEIPASWEGFDNGKTGIKYLKLHGSLTWSRLDKDMLKVPLSTHPLNNIIKMETSDTTTILKDEFKDKSLVNDKGKYQFNTSHIIMGGGKDSKISDNPFIELYRQWQNALSCLDTLVIVGLSPSDIHLSNQIRELLINNKRFEKIIIINPDGNSLHTFGTLWGGIKKQSEIPYVFGFPAYWDIKELTNIFKISLSDMIMSNPSQLHDHISELKKQLEP